MLPKIVRNTTALTALLLAGVLSQDLVSRLNTMIGSEISQRLVIPQLGYFGCIAIGCLGAIALHAVVAVAPEGDSG